MYRFHGNGFYPHSLRSSYEAAGTWPADGVDISDKVYSEFSQQPPYGHRLGTDGRGRPYWEPLPPPTDEEIAAQAKAKLDGLIAEVDAISPVRWASLEQEDQVLLVQYRKALVAISKLPDFPNGIVWPNKPEALNE